MDKQSRRGSVVFFFLSVFVVLGWSQWANAEDVLSLPIGGDGDSQPRQEEVIDPGSTAYSGMEASPSVASMPSGWLYPTGSSSSCGYLSFLAYNSSRYPYHLAQDMCNGRGSPIYSIGNGEVILSSTSVGGYGPGYTKGGALVARYQAGDGSWFTALYGHLDRTRGTGPVGAGDILGYSNAFSPPHLHFGVHPGSQTASNPYRGYSSSRSNTYGWVDPIPYLNAHSRGTPPPPIPPFESNWNIPSSRTSPDLTRDAKAVRAAWTAESAAQVVLTGSNGYPETFRWNDGSVAGRPRGSVNFPPAADLARFSAIKVVGVVNIVARGGDVMFLALRASDNTPVMWVHRAYSAWAGDAWVPIKGLPVISACFAGASDGTRVRLSALGTDGRALFCSDTTVPNFTCAPSFATPYVGVVPIIAYDPAGGRTAFSADTNTASATYSSTIGSAPPTSWVPGANTVQELDMVLAAYDGKVYNLWRGPDSGLRFSSSTSTDVRNFMGSTVRLGTSVSPRAPALVGSARELLAIYVGKDAHLYWMSVLPH